MILGKKQACGKKAVSIEAWWVRLTLVLMVLGGHPKTYGQPNFPVNLPKMLEADIRYRVEDMGGRQDLSSSEISALFQDKDGFIWIGNQPGLSRFDGYNFQNFTQASGQGIGQINGIVQDSTGSLWAAGESGLFWYDQGQFRKAPIEDLNIQDLHLTPGGDLWVVGLGFLPFKLSIAEREQIQQGRKVVIRPIVSQEAWSADIGELHTWAIDTDQQGNAWLGLDDRHAYFDGRQLHITWKDTTDLYEYCAIAAVNRDSVFWGAQDVSLLLQHHGKLEKKVLPATYIMQKTDSCIYFLSTQELVVLKKGRWTRLHTLDEYGYIYAKKMLLDREGNFWIGGVGNLLKLTPARLHHWAYPEFPALTSSHGINGLPDGPILIGSYGGRVLEKTDEGFQVRTRLQVPNYSYVGDVLVDERGWIWYVTSASGIAVERDGELTRFTLGHGLPENPQLFFYRDGHGDIWAGGESSITHIRVVSDTVIQFEGYPAALPENGAPIFQDMFEGPDGRIWAVSKRGLYTLDGAQLVKMTFPGAETAFPVITGAAVDEQDQLWLSTQGEGLWQADFSDDGMPRLIRRWTTDDGLPSDITLDVHIDRLRRIWVSAQNGLGYLTPEDTTWQVRTIDRLEGWPDLATPHSEFYESPDGRLWVINFTSLVEVPIYKLPENRVPPQSFITRVELFEGRENVFLYATNTAGKGVLPQQLVLPHDKNFLRFHFTTTSYTQTAKNRFRYRLHGLDPEWNETRENRSEQYPGLQPGNYLFELQAINNDGVPSEVVATYAFSIARPWYQRWWAYGLWFLILAGGVVLTYRFQLSRKLAREEAHRLQELDAFKSRFYANITHEFRTPITVILGMLETIETINEDEPRALHAADMIRRNGTRLLTLVNELLDLEKLRHGKMDLQFVQMDIIPYVKYVCESYHSLTQSQRIDFVVDSEIDTLIMDVDSEKIAIILSNLISNAIKFTPENGTVTVRFRLVRESEKPFLILEVADTGIGLSVSDQKAVFERFYQSPANGEANKGGTGIGLTLTKELVEQMGGNIGLDSEPGKGSIFEVRLPVSRKAPIGNTYPLAPPAGQKEVTGGFEMSHVPDQAAADHPTVLIIEDSADVAAYLQQCLTGRYTLLYAPDGKQGTTLALEHIPDLIISDVMMPEMDGFAVCELLKNDERTNHIPIILLTARATVPDKVTGIRQGADAYMIKPFAKEELLARLDQLLALRAMLQRKYTTGLIGHPPDKPLPLDPGDAFLVRVEGIVFEHLEDDTFSGADLAQELHLSDSQTYRKLKALTGMSTAVYIRHVRLQRARTLLSTTQLTIAEIAFRTGFKSPGYFSQSFKEAFGESPTAFRDNFEE